MSPQQRNRKGTKSGKVPAVASTKAVRTRNTQAGQANEPTTTEAILPTTMSSVTEPNPKHTKLNADAGQAKPADNEHTAEEIRSWDEVKLLDWIQKKLSPQLKPKHEENFKTEEISGGVFLSSAGKIEFFQKAGFPFGVSVQLAELAGKIIDRKRDSEQAGLAEPSDTASKKLRTETDNDEDLIQKYRKLHSLLWEKETELRDVVFVKKTVSVPVFAEDGASTPTALELNVLSLDAAIQEHLKDNPEEKEASWKRLLPCGSNSLVFREAYRELLDCITAQEKRNGYTSRDGATVTSDFRAMTEKGFIVTGHPGIGKTWFLSSVLVDRLLRGEVTILQVAQENATGILLFDGTGVDFLSEVSDSRRKATKKNVEVWALADQKARGFVEDFSRHEWLVLVTSSPKRKNYKTLDKEYVALIYYMQVWSWPEIVLASGTDDPDELRTLYGLFDRYGPIARLLLKRFKAGKGGRQLQAQQVKPYDDKIESKLGDLLRGNTSLLSGFNQDDSHTVVLLLPDISDTSTYKHISTCFFQTIATPTIGRKLGLLASDRALHRAKELYDWMLHSAHFTSAAGWVFEARAHTALRSGGSYRCRVLTARVQLEAIYKCNSRQPQTAVQHSMIAARKAALKGTLKVELKPSPDDPPSVFADLRNLSEKLRRTKNSTKFNRELREIYYWIHEQRNLGAIDLLAISVNTHGQPRAIFFQLTVSKNHEIGGKSLLKVWGELPDEIRQVPPAIVFVVPMHFSAGYKVQKVDIAGLGISVCNPAKWPQFVLGLDDKILWGPPQNVLPDTPSTDQDLTEVELPEGQSGAESTTS